MNYHPFGKRALELILDLQEEDEKPKAIDMKL